MARRVAGGWRTWACLVFGLGAAIGLACVPGLPFGPGRWPAGGPFGGFTWGAWLVSTGLALTLGALGAAPRQPVSRVRAGAAGFGLLAVLAYLAAARVDLIERYPVVALGLAALALMTLRRLVRAVLRPVGAAAAGRVRPAARQAGSGSGAEVDDQGETDDERAPLAMPRWASVLATVMAGLLVLVVALGVAVQWLGPGLGLSLTTTRPAPLFHDESTFFEYEAARRGGADVGPYLRPPAPDSVDAARRTVLPAGARLSIKGWVEVGIQVRVERDPTPGAPLVGEWGYVRLRDVVE